MESILVTGCLGFIGSHVLEELLLSNLKVIGLDSFTYAANVDFYRSVKDNCEIHNIDICNSEAVKKIVFDHKIKKIINLAAETHVDNSIKDSTHFIKSNILGVHSLLELIKKYDIELIQFSTDEVYGPAAGKNSFDEFSPINPQNPYSASKASADVFIQSYRNTYGINAKILRPSNNFGPRQHQEKLLSKTLSLLRNDKKIPVYGNGRQVRQWTYVKDTAKIVRKLIEENKEFDILNVTSGFEIENLEALKCVCTFLKKNLDDFVEYVDDRPGHDVRYSISSKKMNDIFEFNFTNFDLAIRETIFSDSRN